MKLDFTTPDDAEAMSQAHAGGFDRPWTPEEFADLLEGEGIYGFLAADQAPLGVILCRVAADEMEVLTIAVTPEARRRGVAKALMTAGLGAARAAGAASAFLEVAVDNAAAAALYAGLGFRRAGLRTAYYDRGPAGLADALIMRLDLGPAGS